MRLGLLLLPLALGACLARYEPRVERVDEPALTAAAELLAQAQRDEIGISVVEGLLAAEVYYYDWEERFDWRALSDEDPWRDHQLLEAEPVRVWRGPIPLYFSPDELSSVRAVELDDGAVLELVVTHFPRTALVRVGDPLLARQLADALELLRVASQLPPTRDVAAPPPEIAN